MAGRPEGNDMKLQVDNTGVRIDGCFVHASRVVIAANELPTVECFIPDALLDESRVDMDTDEINLSVTSAASGETRHFTLTGARDSTTPWWKAIQGAVANSTPAATEHDDITTHAMTGRKIRDFGAGAGERRKSL